MRAGYDPDAAGLMLDGIRADEDRLRAERTHLERRLAAARTDPHPGADVGWADMTVAERREWLARYVGRVVIHPAGMGHRFDPATVEVVPGAWWQHPGHPGRPEPPAAVARATAPAPAVRITQPRTCTLPGCGRDHSAHGLCGMHGQRQRRAGPDGQWDRSPGPLPHSGGRGPRPAGSPGSAARPALRSVADRPGYPPRTGRPAHRHAGGPPCATTCDPRT